MNNPQINNKNTLEYDEYIKIVHQAINMNCQDIINIHKGLIGITDTNSLCKTEYGESFILNILNYDFGYNYVKDTPVELLKFFNSKHTSDYLKKIINKYNNNQSSYISNLVNSDKDIKDFNEEELYSIYKLLELYGLSEIIIALSFKLESFGAINFLNNKVNPITLIKRIIYTSGLSARPEYYARRGARLADLNGKMLYSIYNKLVRLDEYKGLNMAIMTLSMKSMSATEFLENLYLLVENNYNLDDLQFGNNNYSLCSSRYNERKEVATCIYTTSLNNIKIDDTEKIKEQFRNLLSEDTLNYIKELTLINQKEYNYQLRRIR